MADEQRLKFIVVSFEGCEECSGLFMPESEEGPELIIIPPPGYYPGYYFG